MEIVSVLWRCIGLATDKLGCLSVVSVCANSLSVLKTYEVRVQNSIK